MEGLWSRAVGGVSRSHRIERDTDYVVEPDASFGGRWNRSYQKVTYERA